MKKEIIYGRYEIYYPQYNAKQVKTLVSHNDYENELKPLERDLKELANDLEKAKKKKRLDDIKDIIENINTIKSYIVSKYGDNYFTDESPIFKSIENGGIMVLPSWQGGEIKVVLSKI